jgi:hypothetical protein
MESSSSLENAANPKPAVVLIPLRIILFIDVSSVSNRNRVIGHYCDSYLNHGFAGE